MHPNQPDNALALMQAFCADEAPRFAPSPTGDDLAEFLEWYVANPRHAAIPFRHGFAFDQGVCCVTLFRQPPYQVEMVIIAPGCDFPDHIHPDVDSFEIFLGGRLELRLAGQSIVNPEATAAPAPNGLSFARGFVMRLKPTDWPRRQERRGRRVVPVGAEVAQRRRANHRRRQLGGKTGADAEDRLMCSGSSIAFPPPAAPRGRRRVHRRDGGGPGVRLAKAKKREAVMAGKRVIIVGDVTTAKSGEEGSRLMKRVLFCLIVIFITSNALADEVHVMGAGSTSSCGAWLEDRKKPNGWLLRGNWALGFLSGLASYSRDLDPLRGLDAGAVFGWLDKHCRENPLKRFTRALDAFVDEHPR